MGIGNRHGARIAFPLAALSLLVCACAELTAEPAAPESATAAPPAEPPAAQPVAESVAQPAVPEAPTQLTNAQVRDAQRRLAELGYYTGAIDGLYGPNSIDAVARFQAANGLRLSRALDLATLTALHAPTTEPILAPPPASTAETAPAAEPGDPPPADEKPLQDAVAESFPVDQYVGVELTGFAGRDLGTIETLLIGPDGRVSAMIVGIDRFLGFTYRYVAVALSEVERRDGKVVCDLTMKELRTRPAYVNDKGTWRQVANRGS